MLKKIFLVLFVFVALSTTNNSYARPGDFDADGTSDLSVALVERSFQRTAWATRLSSGATPLFWTFNVAADALVSMRYHTGDPRYYPGVIFVRDANRPLEWYIKNALNNNIGFTWGLPGDIIPAQGDLDCDGREDPTVVRNQNGVLNWYSYRTATNTLSHTVFGVNGDAPAVTDTKGDCTADLVVLRNNFFWFIRDPQSANFSTQQWGVNGDIPLLPTDLDGDRLVDYVISRPSTSSSGSQTAFILHGNGKFQVQTLGLNTSIPQIGKFTNEPVKTFAWSQRDAGATAIRSDNGNVNVFQFGIAANAIIRPDGTVVQPNSNGKFPSEVVTPPTNQDPTTPPANEDSGPVVGCPQVISVSSGNRSFIYKQSAPLRAPGHGPIIGFRQEPTLIMNINISSRGTIPVLDIRGNVLARCPWATADGHSGGRARCSVQTSGIRQAAIRNTGSPSILFKVNPNQCVQVPDAGLCVNSVKGQCDRLIR
jgi:hypothetical protein